MKNTFLKKINTLLVIVLCLINSFVTGQSFTETLETDQISNSFTNLNVKRRSITYDENLKVRKEVYYGFKEDSYETQILGVIEYSKSDSIDRIITYLKYPQKYIEVDFKNGVYNNYINKTFLKFKNNYIFDGLQKGNKIVINYKDGKRNGTCLQTDSGVIYSKNIIVQRPNIKLIQFDIIRFSSQIETEDVYQLFNGVHCTFINDKINGVIKGFYLNGTQKLESLYDYGTIVSYTSYDDKKLTTNKIPKNINGIIPNNIILNGVVTSEKKDFLPINSKINNIGKIIKKDNSSFSESQRFKITLNEKNLNPYNYNNPKKEFLDKNKIILDHPDQILKIFEIPKFELLRLQDKEENEIDFYHRNFDTIQNSQLGDIINEISFFHIDSYFEYSILSNSFYENESKWSQFNQEQQLGIVNPDQSSVNHEEYRQLLLKNFKTIIYYSGLIKNNIFNSSNMDINHFIKFYEGYGHKMRFIDKNSKKYIEVSTENSDVYQPINTNLYTYFDGQKKYYLKFTRDLNIIKLEKWWIDQ
jgi:hypothetical protein